MQLKWLNSLWNVLDSIFHLISNKPAEEWHRKRGRPPFCEGASQRVGGIAFTRVIKTRFDCTRLFWRARGDRGQNPRPCGTAARFVSESRAEPRARRVRVQCALSAAANNGSADLSLNSWFLSVPETGGRGAAFPDARVINSVAYTATRDVLSFFR